MKWLVLVLLVLFTTSTALAGSIKTGLDFGFMISWPTVPNNAMTDFTEGYGKNPTHPNGTMLLPGGHVSFDLSRHTRLTYKLALPLTLGYYKGNNSQREVWHPPGWGEAYSYAMISQLSYQSISLGYVTRNEEDIKLREEAKRYGGDFDIDDSEWGLRLSLIGMTVRQGYDRYAHDDFLRSFKGRGVGLSAFYRTTYCNFELGPFAQIDYGKFGKGSLCAFTFTFSKTY